MLPCHLGMPPDNTLRVPISARPTSDTALAGPLTTRHLLEKAGINVIMTSTSNSVWSFAWSGRNVQRGLGVCATGFLQKSRSRWRSVPGARPRLVGISALGLWANSSRRSQTKVRPATPQAAVFRRRGREATKPLVTQQRRETKSQGGHAPRHVLVFPIPMARRARGWIHADAV